MKEIPNYPGYTACENGVIFGRRFSKPLKPGIGVSGYYHVTLCNSTNQKQFMVHRIIAELFVPGQGEQVNHKSGIKTDNRASNLEWFSRSHNQKHAADIGLKPSGEDSHLCIKLCDKDVLEIRKLLADGLSQRRIAARFNIGQPTVSKIKNRQKWRQLK